MSLHRTYRKRLDRKEASETRSDNRFFKDKERSRRDVRMAERIRSHKPPYHPAVLSWLSRKLEKPAAKIDQSDINSLLT